MIGRIEFFLRKLRRFFSRSYWVIRLLGLSSLSSAPQESGLVMVQIDGLSKNQFDKALQKKRTPFLSSLLAKEHYVEHVFYSGLPSNTPAVQAEIFYGIKGCVPSFSFMDRQTGQNVKMFDASYVEKFQKKLEQQATGILTGGSAYSNIFTGGAKEGHFCFAQLGWGGVMHATRPWVLPFLILLYIDIFIKTFLLLIIEFFVAIFECIKGTISGRIFSEELRFVWLRVLVCVFLREVMVAGVCIDIMRGHPVIHLNFLGYDEQAHCRGPFSRYAHWALKGIDNCIRRIDRTTKQTEFRQYDLWVYSDHGQERTTPYFIEYGITIEDAVQKLFGSTSIPASFKSSHSTDFHSHSRLLKKRKITAVQVETPSNQAIDFLSQEAIVTAMGPLGQIYVKKKMELKEFEFFARKLVDDLKIPLVMMKGQDNQVIAHTPHGRFVLPNQIKEVFGEDHPFLEEFKEDVIRICHHPNAGEFVIAGWSKGQPLISFPLEYGAHAAMGADETRGFALLPLDVPLENRNKKYVRPVDLHEAVKKHLNKKDNPFIFVKNSIAQGEALRIMSYNVHGCQGMDGFISTERIARVIARHSPDIIALQELDVGRLRSRKMDQARRIADYLEMKYHFHSVFFQEEEQYGNALLSRYPLTLIKKQALPILPHGKRNEPRGALWALMEFQGRQIYIVNTHLSIWPRERVLQTKALLAEKKLVDPSENSPIILCGDFNATPGSAVYKRICEKFKDSQTLLQGQQRQYTWFGSYPLAQIDHVFVTSHFQIQSASVSRTSLDKVASDHLPLLINLKII